MAGKGQSCRKRENEDIHCEKAGGGGSRGVMGCIIGVVSRKFDEEG